MQSLLQLSVRSLAVACVTLAATSAFASVADQFLCKLSFEGQSESDSFAIEQNYLVPRERFDYGHVRGYNPHVTQSEIPVNIELGNNSFSYKFVFRYALNIGAVGVPMDASQWVCSTAVAKIGEQEFKQECMDAELRPNPFKDPSKRWEDAPVFRDVVKWPEGAVLSSAFETPQGNLSFVCKFLETFY
jgi:hypothetical protein